jgi:hypothetical protein
MTYINRRLVLAIVIAAMAITSLASSAPASARNCGFNYDEVYRHCDPNTRVFIAAKNVWGTIWVRCVGYSDTDLGTLSYWRIVNAWYIGRTC